MSEQTKFRETTASQKLVEDPFAAEKDWLPAFLESPTAGCDSRGNNSRTTKLKTSAGVVTIIGLSAVIAYIVSTVVDCGYNWGYILIEKLASQPNGASQGLMASHSLLFVIQPLTFALGIAAFAKQFRRNIENWKRIALSITFTFCVVLLGVLRLDSSGGLLTGCIWTSLALCSSWTGFALGEHLYGELRKRVAAPRMLITGILALLPVAIMQTVQVQNHASIQVVAYFLSIACGTGLAVRLTKARDMVAALLIGVFALFPVYLANALNIACTGVSLLLDNFGVGASLGKEALASAIAINLVALAALALGTTLGYKFSPNKVRTAKLIQHQH